MRLLLVSWGRGLGHITRCLAVAAEANRQSNQIEVYIATDGQNATLLEQVICTPIYFPEDLIAIHPWEGWHNAHFIDRFVDADLEIIKAVNPDVVLHDVRPTIPIACELANIPCAMFAQCDICPGFLYPNQSATSIKWTPMLPAINEVLAKRGLQLAKNDLRELFCRHTILIPSIPEFDIWSAQVANAAVSYTGPLLLRAGDKTCAKSFSKEQTVSTIFVYGVIQSQFQLDQLIQSFRNSPFHLLITALPNNISISEEELSTSQVSIYPFVDVVAILPKCAAAIIHGGHGSCMSVLASGVPAIIIPGSPQEAERIHNGQRLETMGMAKCILGEIEWGEVRHEVEIFAQESIYRLNAQKWKKRVQEMKGAEYALEVLTKIAF